MYRSQAQEQGEEECHYKAGVPRRLSGVGRHEANVVWAAGATADDKYCPTHTEFLLTVFTLWFLCEL